MMIMTVTTADGYTALVRDQVQLSALRIDLDLSLLSTLQFRFIISPFY